MRESINGVLYKQSDVIDGYNTKDVLEIGEDIEVVAGGGGDALGWTRETGFLHPTGESCQPDWIEAI